MKALLALPPLLCIALAGGTTPWSQAVLLAVVGLWLVVAPPRRSLGWPVNGVLAALLLLAGTAFLPAGWFRVPAWRTALADDLSTPLPAALSPQPWLSLDALVACALGLAWVYLVLAAAWTPPERLRAARIFAAGVAALSVVFVLCHKLNVTVPGWHTARNFGPFPNRNQTANFLAVGALPALALARVAWRARRWGAVGGWLLAWAAVAVGVFNSFSRAGLGILFLGTVGFLGYEALRRSASGGGKDGRGSGGLSPGARQGRQVALAVSLVLLLASAFFVLGGETLQRVRREAGSLSGETISGEFRIKIQRDALDMIAASPWCGVGLANFSAVYAEYRVRSAIPSRAVHPESDYLWLAAELGWPGLALALAGLWLLLRRVWPPRRGPDRPVRAAAALAVGLFLLHGFVDVSAHRLGTAMCGVFLLGLAWPGRGEERDADGAGGKVRMMEGSFPGRWPWTMFRLAGGSFAVMARAAGAATVPARWPGVVFRVVGVGFLVLGGMWWQASHGALDEPGAARVESLAALARGQSRAGDYASAERSVSRALAWAPLDWSLYFLRGTVRIYTRDPAGALADFRRARYLEPLYGAVPTLEAQLWANSGEPELAASALLEACRREPEEARPFVAGVFRAARGAAFRRRFAEAARRDPALEVYVLAEFQPPESGELLAEAVERDPALQRFDDAQKTLFFSLWAERGDAASLVAQMAARPAWQALGWRSWAQAERRLAHVEAACGIVAAHAPPPFPLVADYLPLTDAQRAELERTLAQDPGNVPAALGLHHVRQEAGDMAGAAAALRGVTSRPDAPSHLHYLEAQAAGKAGEWPQAWEAWGRYLRTLDVAAEQAANERLSRGEKAEQAGKGQ